MAKFEWQDFNAWSNYTRRDESGHFTQAIVYRIVSMDKHATEILAGSNLALYPGSDPLWLVINERSLNPVELSPTFIGLFIRLESAKYAIEQFCQKELGTDKMEIKKEGNTVTPRKIPVTPADHNADYDALAKRNRELTLLNTDLNAQCVELRKSKLLSPGEEEAIKSLRGEFDRLNADVNKLGLWLRDNKAMEIRQGKHMGMSLSEICIMYMARGL